MTLLDEIDPRDMVDLEAGGWRPVPNEPADDIHAESLIAAIPGRAGRATT